MCKMLSPMCFAAVLSLPFIDQVQVFNDVLHDLIDEQLPSLYFVFEQFVKQRNLDPIVINAMAEEEQIHVIKLLAAIGSTTYFVHSFPIEWVGGVDLFVHLFAISWGLTHPTRFALISALLVNEKVSFGQLGAFAEFSLKTYVQTAVSLIRKNKPKRYILFLVGLLNYIEVLDDDDVFITTRDVVKVVESTQPFDDEVSKNVFQTLALFVHKSRATIDFSIPILHLTNIIMNNRYSNSFGQLFFTLLHSTIAPFDSLEQCVTLFPPNMRIRNCLISLSSYESPADFCLFLRNILN
ncbi:hypothetical protein EIN_055110 [Entamoeba invadens IP1]|uniref:hypothetical protein n=1 Tax=Entamoeba invadens IP1 TaxID=370355 RepID=UPI0002C3E9BC|nr:hypothetical protein EIN_055110 [Entamoeba invadens IP1]ELP93206.1 hypothetical protein EIN_055110 [Entamoeba invadens IP1]|eukprot:XP_004259977.1 hypothetical protein EIN_055110 [Entamoeba invadens IP1]